MLKRTENIVWGLALGLCLVGWLRPGVSMAERPRQDLLANAEAARRTGPYIVVIDAGHGGKDQGTAGVGIALEKTVVLGIARSMAAHLADRADVQVVLTRDDDRFVKLEERVEIARRARADLFVSIHANSAPNRRARGAEVYFLNLDGATDEAAIASENRENAALLIGDSRVAHANDDLVSILVDMRGTLTLRNSAILAEKTLARLRSDGVVAGRSVKQAKFVVLRTLSMPSILVEAGFLSHREEASLLAEPVGQSRIGFSLARSVVDYLAEMGDRGPAEQLPDLRLHTVQRGDTLWSLARAGGWSVTRLKNANALSDNRLAIGQRILLP